MYLVSKLTLVKLLKIQFPTAICYTKPVFHNYLVFLFYIYNMCRTMMKCHSFVHIYHGIKPNMALLGIRLVNW